MMSPLTVAQYLKPGHLTFDLVVMDEASQIKPEDAIGALLRGNQTIIVGDPKQLPPTNFFDRALDDEGGEDDDDDPLLHADDKIVAESVLDLAARSFQPARRLRWHYRSRHERLIAFSNREFYDDDLIVFPASSPMDATLGIEVVQMGGVWRNRTNAEEAQAVAKTIVDFVSRYPELSYGVVSMNQPQRELIQAELDVLALNDPDMMRYRDEWEERLEPPFVKNLENVQGDERDVIFISLGWGRTPTGGMFQRFYPVNRKEDGHRRLNVLFTRARRKVVVFTSIRPEDIVVDPEKTSRGVTVLRDYLLYGRDGKLVSGSNTERPADSPFELAVAQALRRRGYTVDLQVGVAGYFIDIAVRHPDKLAHFVLGIECDGATYHSAKSARDRDRLRQEALESLGWRLVRVWSTDWFRNHDAEADRLAAEVSAAIKADDGAGISPMHLVDPEIALALSSLDSKQSSDSPPAEPEIPQALARDLLSDGMDKQSTSASHDWEDLETALSSTFRISGGHA
jgi:very-short-patch-repair endonuclease